MKVIKVALLSLAFVSTLSQAAVPCDGFQISVTNNLADDLVATKINLDGASIEPDGFNKLNSKSSQVFTVSKSENDVPMAGDMTFHTVALPIKTIKIKFNLTNQGLICQHDDKTGNNDYSVGKTRLPNEVKYTIFNQ